MRILVANWQDLENPQAGGAEIHLFELLSRLVQWGHDVHLVCSGWPGAAPHATVQGVSVERHGGRHSFALLGRGAMRRALRARGPDILVEDVNKLPLYLAGLAPIPCCVLVPHLFGTTAFEEVSWPMAATVWLAERGIPRAYRRAGFHAISESTRDDLVARGVPAGRIRVIHPGVDAARFTPLPGLDRTTAPSFVYVGRLRRYKGIQHAIEAVGEARRQRPDLTLTIAGTGDDRARLEGIVAANGLGDAVRFVGFVPEEEKVRLFRTAWANLFPSPKEGWGITVIEAAACGTPSVASDSPGLRDSVRAGETGLLVPHGSVPALAGAMLALASDRARVERLGAAARRWAESLSWEAAARATEAQLSELVAAHGAPPTNRGEGR